MATESEKEKNPISGPISRSNSMNLGIVIVTVAVLGFGIFFYNKHDGATASSTYKPAVASQSTSPTPAETTTTTDSAASDTEVALNPGDPAPRWTLPTPDGDNVSLADFEGKPQLVIFEATWCTFCQREHQDVEDIKTNFGDQIEVTTVYMREDTATVQTANEARGTERRTLLDNTGEIALQYGVTGTPTHVFINSDLTVNLRRPGLMTYDQISDSISQLN